jgi:hypothetical protein
MYKQGIATMSMNLTVTTGGSRPCSPLAKNARIVSQESNHSSAPQGNQKPKAKAKAKETKKRKSAEADDRSFGNQKSGWNGAHFQMGEKGKHIFFYDRYMRSSKMICLG